LDGLQQLRRPTAVPKGVHGVFPADGVLQLCGSGGRGGVFFFVIDGDALPSTPAFCFRPPRGRLRWSARTLRSSKQLYSCAPLILMVSMGSRWQVHARHSKGVHVQSPQ
jgi:uncharacterized protein YqjF (DUF2071 family)